MPYCVLPERRTKSSPLDKTFLFSHAVKEPERQKMWISIVNRKNWLPGGNSLICWRHFVDSEPSAENPYPSASYGMD